MKRELNALEVKELLFVCLRKFADYCDKHNLRYYLCYGTLIGAVRHQDFIPWDDDVDVMMPRDDYNRLHDLLATDPLEPYYMFCSYENGKSQFPFAKILDMRTETLTSNKLDRHLWIDIFPIDALPNDEIECDSVFRCTQKWITWFLRAQTKFGEGKTFVEKYLRMPLFAVARLIGCRRCSARIIDISTKYDFKLAENVAVLVYGFGTREKMKKEELIKQEELMFHGSPFKVPANWHEYLTTLYGEYMKLPPAEERTYHMSKTFINE